MPTFSNLPDAFGAPGTPPCWTHANKDGIGTAYAASTRLWFTIWKGHVTEVYYPTIDRPQIRDLLCLLTDGETFFHDDKHSLPYEIEAFDNALGFHVTQSDPEGRYTLAKTVITDPHQPCLLQRVKVTGSDEDVLNRLKLYILCSPHLEGGGMHNNAYIVEIAGRDYLAAEKQGRWLVMHASCGFARCSVGYVGESDGWTDLNADKQMDFQFGRALDGNVALTGEIELAHNREFTLGIAFGETLQSAISSLLVGLSQPFDALQARYTQQWQRVGQDYLPLGEQAQDGGCLYRNSVNILLAHEDKTYPGALIASLAIPWGEIKGDEEGLGGYHLVWTRDMVQCALGLLAAGDMETPFRALIYLVANQKSDGSFAQNFWVDGTPYWTGVQLDEIAFPILLAMRLHRENAMREFDPSVMVQRGLRFLLMQGPATQQERWEEASGYSPSTLAANIAAFVCVADYIRDEKPEAAQFLEEYADWMRDHLEAWTVTQAGNLLPNVPRHFVRINPLEPGKVTCGCLDEALLPLASQPPDAQADAPARNVVDAGFLELVRYGILAPDDPLILDSLKVVDATLKVDTPAGSVWHRYNQDGYGQKPDGSAYDGTGQGRAWPLLTGERGHYELAAGHDVSSFIEAMEKFSFKAGLLPEQVWDTDDIPDAFLFRGRPTGSAAPLLWAHAEYVKLLRSRRDGHCFDRIDAVAARYLDGNRLPSQWEMWSFLYPTSLIARGHTLRIILEGAFRLHWTTDDWRTVQDTNAQTAGLNIFYVDIPIAEAQQSPVRFTFFWLDSQQWEGKDYTVEVAT